ncbi:exodeoxyribonuclease III [Erysipelotrichaceae bacterium RD49]|nr:exodeoxyribonuclease III [Erysipelotrichaceae bacterium RD49]
MKLLTWNLNGYRAVQKKGLEQILSLLDAQIACFQETKAQPDQIEMDEYLYPYVYVNSAVKKGYSGTMIACLEPAQKVVYGLGIEELDQEGRVITAYFKDFALVTVYTPNSQNALKRLDFRQQWDEAFAAYCKSIDRPVLICGDMNIARGPLDIWDEKDGIGAAGYSDEERSNFENYLMDEFVDVFRELYPQKRQYSWWNYKTRGRARNEGWRIDYWLASKELLPKIQSIQILDDVFGSDHCPVMLDIDVDF